MKKEKINELILIFFIASLICGIFLIFTSQYEKGKLLPVKIAQKEGKIFLMNIYGPVYFSGASAFSIVTGADRIVNKLDKIKERDDIKAIVLRINSPGGSVGAVQEIYFKLLELKKKGKKIVVSMGDVAASGAYYIAAGADKIIANPGTLTGSIGVILELGNVQELFKKIGVKIVTIKSGKYKDIGSPFRELTDEERKSLQQLIDNAYNQFIDAIALGRKIDKSKVLEVADGRIFTASQAKDLGLVDYLGNLEVAVTVASKLAGIKGKPKLVYETDKLERFLELLESKMSFKERFQNIVLPFEHPKVRFEYMME